jgi:hypothetical protein
LGKNNRFLSGCVKNSETLGGAQPWLLGPALDTPSRTLSSNAT